MIEDLIANRDDDEEIIVIDGNSSDGTREYLHDLYEKKYIQKCLSEDDYCQAHAMNKGILMAEGAYLKFISDDDYYHYPSIKKCKEYLEENNQIDVLVGNIGIKDDQGSSIRTDVSKQNGFECWLKNDQALLWFSDHAFFLKKSKIPLVGLWNTTVICPDYELSQRIISQKQLNIAWYSGYISVAIPNYQSNGTKYHTLVDADAKRINRFYRYDPYSMLHLWYIATEVFAHFRHKIKTCTINILTSQPLNSRKHYSMDTFRQVYHECQLWVTKENKNVETSFIISNASNRKKLLQ